MLTSGPNDLGYSVYCVIKDNYIGTTRLRYISIYIVTNFNYFILSGAIYLAGNTESEDEKKIGKTI